MSTDNIYPLGINVTTGKPERASTSYGSIAGDFVQTYGYSPIGYVQYIATPVDEALALSILNASTGTSASSQFSLACDTTGFQSYVYGPNYSSASYAGSYLETATTGANGWRMINGASQPITIESATGVLARWRVDGQDPITISPTALAANTDNYNPTSFAGSEILRLSASAPVNLTGLVAPATGSRIVVLANIGLNTITLIDNATSTAANRFSFGGGINVPLDPGSVVTVLYDATTQKWRSLATNTQWAIYNTVVKAPIAAQTITRDADANNSLTITNPNVGASSASSLTLTSSVSSLSLASYTTGNYDAIVSTVNGIQMTAGSDITFGVNGVDAISGINTQGARFDAPGTQAITAIGNTITPTATVMELSADGNYTLTSTPTIVAGGDPGQYLILTLTGANTVTLQRESALAGSTLRLGAATRALSQYDTLVLLWDGTYWRETSFTDNT